MAGQLREGAMPEIEARLLLAEGALLRNRPDLAVADSSGQGAGMLEPLRLLPSRAS